MLRLTALHQHRVPCSCRLDRIFHPPTILGIQQWQGLLYQLLPLGTIRRPTHQCPDHLGQQRWLTPIQIVNTATIRHKSKLVKLIQQIRDLQLQSADACRGVRCESSGIGVQFS